MSVLGAQRGVVVTEAVVIPLGFSIPILAGEQRGLVHRPLQMLEPNPWRVHFPGAGPKAVVPLAVALLMVNSTAYAIK